MPRAFEITKVHKKPAGMFRNQKWAVVRISFYSVFRSLLGARESWALPRENRTPKLGRSVGSLS